MKQLKIGIIGAGRIGSLHAKSIAYNVPTATVAGITDVRPEFAQKVADELGIPLTQLQKIVLASCGYDVDDLEGCDYVTTSGHSKGANVAQYIALLYNGVQSNHRTIFICNLTVFVKFKARLFNKALRNL